MNYILIHLAISVFMAVWAGSYYSSETDIKLKRKKQIHNMIRIFILWPTILPIAIYKAFRENQ